MKKDRVVVLDEFRGIAVVLMVIYHVLYSLEFIFGYNLGFHLLTNPFTVYLQRIIGCMFVFISGVSSGLSSNYHINFKNGVKVGIISILITIVTKIIIPEELIVFGVLHFLSVMMLAVALFRYCNKKHHKTRFFHMILSGTFAILFIACYNIGESYSNTSHSLLISILGFPAKNFYSADYYPILPWGFLFLSGFNLSESIKKFNKLKIFRLMSNHSWLSYIGENSLVVYIVHQPIIIVIIYILQEIRQIF